jgi:hypothetical protein
MCYLALTPYLSCLGVAWWAATLTLFPPSLNLSTRCMFSIYPSSPGHTYRRDCVTTSSCTARALTKRSTMSHLCRVPAWAESLNHTSLLADQSCTISPFWPRDIWTYRWVPLTCEAANYPTWSHLAYGTHRVTCGVPVDLWSFPLTWSTKIVDSSTYLADQPKPSFWFPNPPDLCFSCFITIN